MQREPTSRCFARLARGVVFLAAILFAPLSNAVAQDALVIRPTAELAPLARRLARELTLRGRATVVGDEPPANILDAVGRYEIALGIEDGELRVVIPVMTGRTVSTGLEPPADQSTASVRAIALSIESLLELAHDESWLEAEPAPNARRERSAQAVDDEPLPEPRSHRVRTPPVAKPTIYLRALIGYSPVRSRLLLGPGTGLGLCVGPHCAVLEGDLSLLPDVRRASDGRRVSYRSVNFSVRVQLRPFRWGDFTPAATFGLITRIGNAVLEGTDTAKLVTNLGLRSTLEIAYRFAPRFEAVLEAGLDIALNRARFSRFGEVILLEDRFTPWFSTSIRLRP